MRELSIQEKAKRYDEAIERLRNAFYDNSGRMCEDYRKAVIRIIEPIFPELKESEDERMSKYLIKYFEANKDELSKGFKWNGITVEECLAWLEKQGEQKPVVIPKFRIGDIIRHKKHGFTCKIIAIDTEYRLSDCMGTHLPFDSQDAYELVEQNPAWSEKDEKVLNAIINTVLIARNSCEEDDEVKDRYDDELRWLKSLRHQKQWKPSEEQMKFLWKYAEQNNYDGSVLTSLYNDLKKLRNENYNIK